jgi:uncharacterized protein (TIGR00369 family)
MSIEILKRYHQTNHFGASLGIELNITEPGNITYKVEVKREHLATLNSAHGGFLAAIMDQVVGTSALSTAIMDGNVVSTVELKMNFLSGAFLGDKLFAKGLVLKKGKKLIVVEGKIFNQNEKLLVTGLATLNAYPFDKSDMNFK